MNIKILKKVGDVFLIAGASLFALSVILSGVIEETQSLSSTALTLLSGVITILLVGTFLSFAKNDVANKLGLALVSAACVLILANTFYFFADNTTTIVSFIFAPIAVIVSLLGVIASLFKKSAYAVDQESINAILSWNKLYKEGVISETEFEEKKTSLLGTEKKDEE